MLRNGEISRNSQDVRGCNWSEFLDSIPFQQAIIQRNRTRNEFKRAILIWELQLQYFKLENWISLNNSPRRWPCLKCSPELISRPISSNYNLLEWYWIKEFRSITTSYNLWGLTCKILQKRKYSGKSVSNLMEYCMFLSSSIYVWKEERPEKPVVATKIVRN
jgi:hypothetical protein